MTVDSQSTQRFREESRRVVSRRGGSSGRGATEEGSGPRDFVGKGPEVRREERARLGRDGRCYV